MSQYLKFKAGNAVINMIRDEGLQPSRIHAFVGPAGGPKWFVSVGFDTAIMKARFLEQAKHRILLAGASAGAWRCIAMTCANPLQAYERLRIAYSRNVFTAADTPLTVGEALRRNVTSFLGDKDIPYILDHPCFDLAVHCVRGRGLGASENSKFQGSALLFGAALNAISPRGMNLFFQRVVFFTGRREPLFVGRAFPGQAVRLNSENLRLAAVATGSLPYIVSGVGNIPGAPKGIYRDGGIMDYQLNQDYYPEENCVTLFFHYQEKIVPGWFDKHLFWRKPRKRHLERVVQVYPAQDFVKLLPDHRIPDRSDFSIFVNDPAERIRRWDEAARLSQILGEEFMDAVASNRLSRQIQPL
jgi:hypothetical protein